MSTSTKSLFLVRFSILLALEAIFCFTPLGSIPIGPMVATLAMVPVIVTAIILGPKAGTLMGFFAGLFSFFVWTFLPPPTSAMFAFVYTPFYSVGALRGNFWSLVICFVPRILTGTVAGLVFRFLHTRLQGKRKVFAYGLAGLLGSMTNTIGVLGGIFIFFGPSYAQVAGIAYELLLGVMLTVVLTNGVPEAILCTVLGAAVCQPLLRITRRG